MSKKSQKKEKRKACMRAQQREKKLEQRKVAFPDIAYGIRATWNPKEKKIFCEAFEDAPMFCKLEYGSWFYNFTIAKYKRYDVLPIAQELVDTYGYKRNITVVKHDRLEHKRTEYSLKDFMEYRDI